MVGFLLVGVILKTLCIFIRIIEGFMLQSADKFLKAVCQMRAATAIPSLRSAARS